MVKGKRRTEAGIHSQAKGCRRRQDTFCKGSLNDDWKETGFPWEETGTLVNENHPAAMFGPSENRFEE